MGVKTETIGIKVSPEEKELIKRLAAEQDVTVSKYLYRLLIKEVNTNVSTKPETH